MSDHGNTTINVAEILAIDEAVLRTSGSPDFGVSELGFTAKPFARLLAEKLALARALFGGDIDLTSGSAIRKLLEVSALEDARTWAALAGFYDNNFIVSATGEALSRLGEDLGIARPFEQARGTVGLELAGDLPSGTTSLKIPRGARMLTPGGHHIATDETVVLSASNTQRTVAAVAFYPGPQHNIDPAVPDQKIADWNREDSALAELFAAESDAGAPLVTIDHSLPFTGGDFRWSDARYRELLLRAPRSLWTVDAVQLAASLVPGVRRALVRDGWGGLDIHQSIFGNFNFLERVFGSERDLGSPYYFTVLVAPTQAAFWEGVNGLEAAVTSAIEDLRPIGIFPRVIKADEIGVGVQGKLVVRGLPLPSGSRAAVNASDVAVTLKDRLLDRVQRYVDGLQFGEPVRWTEVVWSMMNEPGVADIQDLKLLRYPPGFDAVDFTGGVGDVTPQALDCGINLDLQVNQIASFVDLPDGLEII